MSQDDPLRVDSSGLVGLDRLARHLGFHTRRQQLIAANLANLDTPGYRAKELRFVEELAVHVDASGQRSAELSHQDVLVTADDEVPDEDGNTVALERQSARMVANHLRYQELNELLSRKIGLLRYAATDGKS
jgi:flagellar basal-body rod protein FlgB